MGIAVTFCTDQLPLHSFNQHYESSEK